MSSSSLHNQCVGFSPEKSLVNVQQPSSHLSPSSSLVRSPMTFRATLHRTAYTPISIIKKSYEAPKKSIRFLRASQPSTSADLAVHDDEHDHQYDYPGVSSPKHTPARPVPRPLDVSQTSPDTLFAFRAAMARALALANNALSTTPSQVPDPQSTIEVRRLPSSVQQLSLPPAVASPSLVPSPSPAGSAPRPLILSPSPEPAVVIPSSAVVTPLPAIVTPSTPLAKSTPPRVAGDAHFPFDDESASFIARLIPKATLLANTASWIEGCDSPDIHKPVVSTPLWSHCSQSPSSLATTNTFDVRSCDADGSQASFARYRLPFTDNDFTLLGAVAGRRFLRMPKGGTYKLAELVSRDFRPLLDPSRAARHESVGNWLTGVPTPVPQLPLSPRSSFLRRPSPVPSSLFDSPTRSLPPPAASPAAVVADPESPLFYRSRPLAPPSASSCFRAQTASSPSSGSDDWALGHLFPRVTKAVAPSPTAMINNWDDGFEDRVVESPCHTTRLRDLPISPLGSEYFRSSIGEPSPDRDAPITTTLVSAVTSSPCKWPTPALRRSPCCSQHFFSPVASRSPSSAHASTKGPYSPDIPSLSPASSSSLARAESPSAPIRFSWPSASPLPSPLGASTPVSVPPASPASSPAITRSPPSSPSSAVTRSPSPAPEPTRPSTPSPSPAPEPTRPSTPSPSPAQPVEPAPRLSWKIAAGVVAGAFAVTCLASYYLF